MHSILTAFKKRMKKNNLFYQHLLRLYCYSTGMFKQNGIIRNFLIFPLKAFLRIHKISFFYKGYEKLDEIRGCHKGKRIFVIATGPSITIEDVERLEGEITISVNTIFRIFGKTKWRPTYYLTGDPNLMDRLKKSGEDHYEKYSQREYFLSDFNGRKNYKGAIYFPVCWLDHMVYYGSRMFRYSRDMLWGSYCMYTVANTAINLAHYMGAKEIYLLGVDCNYTGNVQHAGGNKTEENLTFDSALKAQEMMTEGYRFIKRELEKEGVKIYNATRGGNLEVFPRVNLEDILIESA